MACEVCTNSAENFVCQFSLDAALENIRKHYKSMEVALQEKTKSISELKERNTKLMKAVDCLKKPETLARLSSFTETFQPETKSTEMLVPSPIFEDITILDDEEEDNALVSVMDTALNGSALNTTPNNEIIAETEHLSARGPHTRRLALKPRTKIANCNKSNCNDENKKPISSPPIGPPISTSTEIMPEMMTPKPKDVKGNNTKSIVKRLSLRQTKLPFDEKRVRSPCAGTMPKRTLTLGKLPQKKDETIIESDDDVFNFDKTASFQFKSPTPKKSKMDFTSPKHEDQSLIAILSPTQTVYFLDDTTFEENFEKEQAEPTKLKPLDKCLNGDSTESLSDVDIIANRKIEESTSKYVDRASKPKIKEEPMTQPKIRKPINPIFAETENMEDSEDEYLIPPAPAKDEPENKHQIDYKTIKCADCRSYIKFCGDRMTKEKMEEHLRKCVHHKNNPEIGNETPEGFWNPLMVSFAPDDPRNEVLIDNRFAGKRTTATGGVGKIPKFK